jgi:hypothetical protein
MTDDENFFDVVYSTIILPWNFSFKSFENNDFFFFGDVIICKHLFYDRFLKEFDY